MSIGLSQISSFFSLDRLMLHVVVFSILNFQMFSTGETGFGNTGLDGNHGK